MYPFVHSFSANVSEARHRASSGGYRDQSRKDPACSQIAPRVVGVKHVNTDNVPDSATVDESSTKVLLELLGWLPREGAAGAET